ncbi:glycoside hydrolase family 88 protein [Lachnoclostridium phytofermentans]|uniref:Glycosyl hydrolase family 88 n=1 Tax=Lachnoclostridium phytofermentans (strain ATCC 700394 / DSM 18823 / ISDg) TaxID=357809 RepID=A9KLI9_LACP7|nr:glycoside hydrolase family 88 protein [Lachnoclostridium phytofermentans]ABX41318.1 glycosyl hydrolase family 88 [Lachnoclostridium phytofermentans ISDg]
MHTLKELEKYSSITMDEVKKSLDISVELVLHNLDEFTNHFPDSNSNNMFYPKTENVEWTTGFWTGEIWLAYEMTGHEKLKHAGNIQVESFLKRIIEKVDVNHHDMGFLYSPSCVAAYQLTGNETAKKAAIMAADNLMERFIENGQYFQAWGEIGASDNSRLIIDCLLNMPLLFWASEVTGESIYSEKAEAHIKTAMNYVIRPDNSTYHTYYFDAKTGEPMKGVTHQGNRDGSAWSRGQAWGIYGAALSYKKLKDPMYLEVFKKVTDYFLEHLPEDLIPYWDFDFDTGSNEPRDSSAGAIACCGMLEMAKYMTNEDSLYYTEMAKKILKALVDRCQVTDTALSNGLLLHGTYAKDSPNNPCHNRGVDECNTWGDYFFLEALVRLHKNWKPYW